MIVCCQDRRVGQAQRSPTVRTRQVVDGRWHVGKRQVVGGRWHIGPLLLALLAIAIPRAAAQEKFDPAARAKVVAPFVDDQTVAVLHVDTSRMPVDAVLAKAWEILPGLEHELGRARKDVNLWLKELAPIAGKELYVVVSTADVGGPWFWYAPRITLVSLKPGVDEKAIAKALDAPDVAKKRIGDFLLIAPPKTMKRLEGLKAEPRPEIAAAFEAAGDTGAQVLLFVPPYARRVIEELLPELPKEIGGGPSMVLTRGIQWIALGGDVAPQVSGRLVIQSQDAQAAEALRNKWVEGFKRVGQYKEVRQFVPQFDQLAALLTPKVEGSRLRIALDGETVGRILDAVKRPLGAAQGELQRERSMRILKQIGLAMHNYQDAHKSFPPPYTVDKKGKPLLSWRVLILPGIGQSALYQQFHLDEAWDSPHNRTLIAKMPTVYRSPLSKSNDPGKTNYVLPVGPGTVFGGKEAPKFSDIKDGVSNTIMAVEVDDEHAVIWSKPDDLPYDPKDPLKGFRGMKEGFVALFCDCSVHFLRLTIEPNSLRALFSAAAGDSADW